MDADRLVASVQSNPEASATSLISETGEDSSQDTYSPEEQRAKAYADAVYVPKGLMNSALAPGGSVPSDVISGAADVSGLTSAVSTNPAFMGPINLAAPGFAQKMLPGLVQGEQNIQAAVDTQYIKEKELEGQYRTNLDNYMGTVGVQGKADAAVFTADAALNSLKGTESTNVLNMFQVNDSDQSQTWATVARQKSTDIAALNAMQADLAQKRMAIPAFVNNPLGWLVGNLGIESEINHHNALLQRVEQETASLDSMASSSNAMINANAPKYALQQAAISLAHADATVAAANTLQARAKLDSLSANSGFIAADLKRLVTKQESDLRLLAASERAVSMEEGDAKRQAEMVVKQKQQDVDASTLASYNRAEALMGWNQSSSLQEFNKRPAQIRAAINYVVNDLGDKIGPDLQTTYMLMSQGSLQNMTGDTQTLVKNLSASWNAVAQNLQKTGGQVFASAKPVDKNSAIAQQVYEQFLGMQQNIGDKKYNLGNIYEAQDAGQMIKIPAVQKTPLASLISQTQQQNPNKVLKDEDVNNLVKAELVKGDDGIYKGSLEAAAQDLTNYYRSAVDHNNATFRFEAFNLPKQENYVLGGIDRTNYKQNFLDMSRTLTNAVPSPITD